MRYSPRNIRIACDHAGLTHFGGVYFFHEFLRVLQLRNFLSRHLRYSRRNHCYSLSQMVLALVYPLVLGLDRLETASFLRSNGTFQYLTGLPSFPDPQTLRRFLLQAPEALWEQMHRVNDRLLQTFIHLPDHRSRLILDLDSTVVTVFGHQERAAVGYNPRYRGKRSYNPLLCIEANSSYLWDTDLRAGNAGTWEGSPALLDTCFVNVPPDIREIRVRADAGFGFNPVFEALEALARRLRSGRPPDFGIPAPVAWFAVSAGQPHLGNDGLRASAAWLAAGPPFLRCETIHPGRRSANDAFRAGAVRVSRLGDEHEPDAGGSVALL